MIAGALPIFLCLAATSPGLAIVNSTGVDARYEDELLERLQSALAGAGIAVVDVEASLRSTNPEARSLRRCRGDVSCIDQIFRLTTTDQLLTVSVSRIAGDGALSLEWVTREGERSPMPPEVFSARWPTPTQWDQLIARTKARRPIAPKPNDNARPLADSVPETNTVSVIPMRDDSVRPLKENADLNKHSDRLSAGEFFAVGAGVAALAATTCLVLGFISAGAARQTSGQPAVSALSRSEAQARINTANGLLGCAIGSGLIAGALAPFAFRYW
jgi:hypothetical protein